MDSNIGSVIDSITPEDGMGNPSAGSDGFDFNEYDSQEAPTSVVEPADNSGDSGVQPPDGNVGDANPQGDTGEPQVISEPNEELESAILALIDHYDIEEQMALESRARLLKLLDYYWQGIQNVFWNDSIGNFSVSQSIDLDDNEELPKIVNIYRPYGEAIIAALSASVPKTRFFPSDAEKEEDVLAAATYSKAAKKIQNDNGSVQLLTKALFVLWNQHFVAAYIYPEKSEKYGTYEKAVPTSPQTVSQDNYICPQCGAPMQPSANPISPSQCPQCGYVGQPFNDAQEVTQVVEEMKKANKTKICIELYGSLNVYVPAWVQKFADTPYVAFDKEIAEEQARDKYQNKENEIAASGDTGLYQRWARLPQIVQTGIYGIVTEKKRWFRPWAFKQLNPDRAALLAQAFPSGLYACKVNDILVEYKEENLDDCWVISEDPISNHIYTDPRGKSLVDIQDMTTDNVNITSDTIRYGIPITFVRSDAVDLKKLEQTRARPGDLIVAKPSSNGGSLNDQFFQTQMATLSDEVPGFQKQLEMYGQFVSGAYASIYGGALQNSGGTLGEYETSRNQSLQRLQLPWRMLADFFAKVDEKAANQYFENVDYDDVFVEPNGNSFKNVYIKLSEAMGSVGKVQTESSDQFPTTWVQQRDIIQNLLTLNNQEINQILGHFKNAPLTAQLIGIPGMYIPGQDDVDKQLYEIAILIKAAPQQMPNGATNQSGQAMLISTVPIDPQLDNDEIHIGVCQIYLKSPEGLAQKDTPGYQNIMAHMEEHQMHQQMMQMQMAQQQAQMSNQNQPPQGNGNESQPEGQ